jgi:hypothetical protein
MEVITMSDRIDPIDDNVEISGSSPKRTRPTDRQMGLGTHDFIQKSAKKKNNHKENT